MSSRFDEVPDDFDPSGNSGSFDDGDPQTTNLYVGNLAPQAEVKSLKFDTLVLPYFVTLNTRGIKLVF